MKKNTQLGYHPRKLLIPSRTIYINIYIYMYIHIDMPHHPRSSHFFFQHPKKGATFHPLSCHTSLPLVASLSCFLNSSNCLERKKNPSHVVVRGGPLVKRRVVLKSFKKEPRIHRNILTCWRFWWGDFHQRTWGKKTGIFVFPRCQPRRKSTTKTLKF